MEVYAYDEAAIPKKPNVRSLYEMTELKTISGPAGEQDFIVPKESFSTKCSLRGAEFRVLVVPWKFQARVNGMCGGNPPSVELTVWRNGDLLLNKLVFGEYCDPPESAINISEVSLSEIDKAARIFVTDGSVSVLYDDLPKLKRDDLAKHHDGRLNGP